MSSRQSRNKRQVVYKSVLTVGVVLGIAFLAQVFGFVQLLMFKIDVVMALGVVFGLVGIVGIFSSSEPRESPGDELVLERDNLKKLLGDQEKLLQSREKELEDQKAALLNLLEDVNQEKQIGERQSQSILETIAEGIVVTDAEGVVSYVNHAYTNMLGYTSELASGKVFDEVMEAFDLKGEKLDREFLSNAAAVTNNKERGKFQLKSKDGKLVAVKISAAPIQLEGEFKGVIRVVHDVSEEVQIERQKDDFFSIASHELRTPLTVISGNIDTVVQGYGQSKISQDDMELLKDSQTATERLIKMINSFLNVSRLDQGRLVANIQTLDACSQTGSIVDEMEGIFKEKGLYLKHECGEGAYKILADEGLLKEVLINLVGNSLKFTSEGGVEIRHKQEDGMLKLCVQDTGVGISSDKQGLLFQRFQQAMNRTLAREAGGTGLGLYISREFMRLMGGDLVLVSSEQGKGSVFEVSVPLAKSEPDQTVVTG